MFKIISHNRTHMLQTHVTDTCYRHMLHTHVTDTCYRHMLHVTDTCYVLSFAIIMLNTSLHNPSVKDKPNVDRFIAMNRGINDGGDLPQDLLEVFICL